MNIAELLQEYARNDEVFYSPCFGEVLFIEIVKSVGSTYIKTSTKEGDQIREFFVDGRYYTYGECMLFPSKIQPDWDRWAKEREIERRANQFADFDRVLYKGKLYSIIESHPEAGHYTLRSLFNEGSVYQKVDIEDITKLDHFDPKLLKPFDQVLVRDSKTSPWCISHFSNMPGSCRPYVCENFQEYQFCIPYNDETANLIGKTDSPHKFYC